MKIRNKYLIFGILFIFLINFVIAAPPVTTVQQFTEGYIIVENPHQYLKLNQDYQYNFFVYNSSDGILMDNTLITCSFFIANSSGEVILSQEAEYFTDGHWGIDILGNNFTIAGEYPYRVSCQDDYGGALAGIFIVTPNGFELITSNAIVLFFILGFLGLFLFFSINGVKNSISGTWMIAYSCLSYILIYSLVGLMYLISYNYLWALDIVSNIFYILWFVMGIGFLPFVIIITLYILGQEAKAVLEKDFMKQGYSREEARTLSKRRK
jgi:hypothetical protein